MRLSITSAGSSRSHTARLGNAAATASSSDEAANAAAATAAASSSEGVRSWVALRTPRRRPAGVRCMPRAAHVSERQRASAGVSGRQREDEERSKKVPRRSENTHRGFRKYLHHPVRKRCASGAPRRSHRLLRQAPRRSLLRARLAQRGGCRVARARRPAQCGRRQQHGCGAVKGGAAR